MKLTVRKIGNSEGVIIPKELAAAYLFGIARNHASSTATSAPPSLPSVHFR